MTKVYQIEITDYQYNILDQALYYLARNMRNDHHPLMATEIEAVQTAICAQCIEPAFMLENK